MRTDLLGDPIREPQFPIPGERKERKSISIDVKRKRLIRAEKANPTLLLFEELFDQLSEPLIDPKLLPKEYVTDRTEVKVIAETGDEEDGQVGQDLPREAWGDVWLSSAHNDRKTGEKLNQSWSMEAINFLQVHVFWESLEEMALNNNEHEKWSVLKWIFRPAIRRQYFVYRKAENRFIQVPIHERDEPFSFHNCCIAACMDEEMVREGVRRNVPVDIMKAIDRICED